MEQQGCVPAQDESASPNALIGLYWNEVWNARRVETIARICGDPIVRHDPRTVSSLNHAEQMARVRQQSDVLHPRFTHEVLLGDERHTCSVWNMTTRSGERVDLSGIEVFEARDGRLTDCWNTPYSTGFWGRLGGDGDILSPRPQIGPDGGSDDGRALVARFFAALAAGDEAALRDVIAAGLVRYGPGGGADRMTVDVLLRDPLVAPGGRVAFDALFAERDLVCAVWNFYAPDGSVASGIDVFRVADARLVEWWAPPRTTGAWGREGDEAVPSDLPPPALLASTAEIDETWVQSVFQHAGVPLPRIAMVRVSPIGHGNASDTVRVSIGYNKPVLDEPTAVICKFDSHYPAVRALAEAIGPYRAEVETYRLFGDEPPLRTARAFHADCSADGARANLVLEDLSAFCEAGDQIAGCSIAGAAAVTRELARLHAFYWNAPALPRLTWIARNRQPTAPVPDFYAAGVSVFEERYAADLGEADMAIIRGFAPLVQGWREYQFGGVTLLHADPRVDNVMFDRRAADARAYIIDWQMVSWGSPAIDLAYFLTGSLSVEDRRTCEHAMIAEHAKAIAQVDPTYDTAAAVDDYRIAAASGLVSTVGAASVMPDTDHNRRLLLALATRNVAAVRDWRTIEILAGRSNPSPS